MNKVMYDDALETLYGKNTFDFGQDPAQSLQFLQSRPAAALPFIKGLCFRVTEEQIDDWGPGDFCTQYRALVQFIKDNLKLANLSLMFDTYEVWDNIQGREDDEESKYYYDAMVELVDEVKVLGEGEGLYDVWFRMGWFAELEGVFGKRVLGKRWVDRHGSVKIPEKSTWEERQWKVPDFYEVREGDLEVVSRRKLEEGKSRRKDRN